MLRCAGRASRSSFRTRPESPTRRACGSAAIIPMVVQSMTTTDTADADKTLEQVYGLAMEGCEVVRVTVKDPPDAAGLPAIVHRSPVPIVADIHFDHKMALAAIEAGVAKLRLNPGNIRDPKKVAEVVERGQSARDSDSRRREHGLAGARTRENARAHGRSHGASRRSATWTCSRSTGIPTSRSRSRRTTCRRPSTRIV